MLTVGPYKESLEITLVSTEKESIYDSDLDRHLACHPVTWPAIMQECPLVKAREPKRLSCVTLKNFAQQRLSLVLTVLFLPHTLLLYNFGQLKLNV